MKRFIDWKSLVVVTAVFVLGSTLAVTYAKTEDASVPTQAQTDNLTNTITVTGSGQASGAPDIANVELGIQVTDPDPSKALAQANDIIAKVTAAVSELGIATTDIQTSGFNLYPQNPPDTSTASVQPNSATVPAQVYQAQISISVRVKDISKVGAVIDAGIKSGANNVSGLSFGIDDPSKLEEQARTLAVANAHERAQQLAAALNMTLGDPIIVNENSGGGSVAPLPYGALASRAQSQISTGQLSVSVDLQITYSMTKK